MLGQSKVIQLWCHKWTDLSPYSKKIRISMVHYLFQRRKFGNSVKTCLNDMAATLDIDAGSIDTSSGISNHSNSASRSRVRLYSAGEPAAVWGRSIKKSYGKVEVLKNLNITVPRGCM